MTRLYLILCASIAGFGYLASNLTGPTRVSVPRSGDVREIAERSIAASDKYAIVEQSGSVSDDAIILDRRGNGHFYANVEINGTPIEMLVDTGASGVALSSADAKRAGIATSIGMNDAIGEGAGGTVYGDFVKIDRVKLGDVEADNIPAVILGGGQMSLLGQSFLRQFASVEISGDRMVLR